MSRFKFAKKVNFLSSIYDKLFLSNKTPKLLRKIKKIQFKNKMYKLLNNIHNVIDFKNNKKKIIALSSLLIVGLIIFFIVLFLYINNEYSLRNVISVSFYKNSNIEYSGIVSEVDRTSDNVISIKGSYDGVSDIGKVTLYAINNSPRSKITLNCTIDDLDENEKDSFIVTTGIYNSELKKGQSTPIYLNIIKKENSSTTNNIDFTFKCEGNRE